MGMKVAKFGGSSLADAAQFKKVREILFSDADRRIVVPSAPGKRGATDIKVTDLFYQCNRLAASGSDFAEAFDTIRARYREIARELELTVDLDGYLDESEYPITGIAGHKDFAIINVEKAMMNSEIGFGRRLLQALEEQGISFEHMPSGIDTMCVVVHESALEGKKEKLVQRIHELCTPDTVEIHSGLALIATVGRGMVRSKGISARLFNALMKAGVNVRLIDQGSSELNIIVGVDNLDFEVATRAIYRAFVTHENRW